MLSGLVARVAELVDALALGASGETRGSSSLPFRTNVQDQILGFIHLTNGGFVIKLEE